MHTAGLLSVLLAVAVSHALQIDTIARNFLTIGNNQTLGEVEYIREKLDHFREVESDQLTYENPRKMNDAPLGSMVDVSDQHILKDTPNLGEINKNLKQYLYQGDIALTANQITELLSRPKRQAYKDSHFPRFRWQRDNEGTIPYYFDSSIDERVKGLIRQALNYWEERTCLRFEENGIQRPTIRFFRGDGCWSYIGKISFWSQQDISIGQSCEHFGTIAHEIGHALGFFHAQSRHDRDEYVSFKPENVERGSIGQFNKETSSTNDNYGMPYDYGSVMHYSDESFAKDAHNPVLVARNKLHQQTMGSRVAPSFVDVLLMNTHYQCLERCANRSNKCQNGGYLSPKNCNECICPWGFEGPLCGERGTGYNGTSKVDCGKTVQATDDWKPLQGMVGSKSKAPRDFHDSCHWHIKASKGRTVQISVVFVGPVCSSGCFYGNAEFKMNADFGSTGYRMCCAHHKRGDMVLTSETDLAVVSLYSRYYYEEFKIFYRQTNTTEQS
ncbi:hypothetical protein QR680_001069 [Steinernema hermaphroditum]|uniref:Zinc metalloproteinase n=1 Tax=Steinernema hermaphroditum TaxID=289476 RepID=A0AA39GWV1_9BILA|nr:hypothetical protein QR680_001069 [Steinernema hermaphroditum]